MDHRICLVAFAFVTSAISSAASVIGDGNAQSFTIRGKSVVVFTQNGTLRVTEPCIAEILLVGGGGGGGGIDSSDASACGGGGGGGGVIHRTSFSLNQGTYQITIGAGGAVWDTDESAAHGKPTTAFGLTAYGGGPGGKALNMTNGGRDGASGGGNSSRYGTKGYVGKAVYASDGNLGHDGDDAVSTYEGGGGGGAGTAATGSRGGDGYACSITGTEVYYAGGGGGKDDDTNGLGAGATNFGGGGRMNRAGGNGVVIVSLGTASDAASEGVVPQVTVSRVSQNTRSRVVEISYTLANAPAVVTFDVLTNGVSIGGANIHHVTGDCNTLIPTNGSYSICWQADKSWPGHVVTNGTAMPIVTAWSPWKPPNYMTVDLNDGSVRYYPAAEFLPGGGLTNEIYRTDWLVMRKIPAAGNEFRLGSAMDDNGYQSNQPMVWVTFSEDFYLGVFEVTQAQLLKVTGVNPSRWSRNELSPLRPAEYMLRDDIRGATVGHGWPNRADTVASHTVDAGSYLRQFRNLTGGAILFDLPTEAQWLFACRAGTYAPFNCGYVGTSAADQANRVARYCDGVENAYNGALSNTSDIGINMGTTVVGSLEPNAFGLYDMIGNVWEYVLDRYSATYGSSEEDYSDIDPVGPSAVAHDGANGATLCGGGYNTELHALNAATRAGGKPSEYRRSFLGFRLWAPATATK